MGMMDGIMSRIGGSGGTGGTGGTGGEPPAEGGEGGGAPSSLLDVSKQSMSAAQGDLSSTNEGIKDGAKDEVAAGRDRQTVALAGSTGGTDSGNQSSGTAEGSNNATTTNNLVGGSHLV